MNTNVVRRGTRPFGCSSPKGIPHGDPRKISEKQSAVTPVLLGLHEKLYFISNKLREKVDVTYDNIATMLKSDGLTRLMKKTWRLSQQNSLERLKWAAILAYPLTYTVQTGKEINGGRLCDEFPENY